MKRIATAAASAFLLLGTAAHAQQQSAMSPLYGELGYSWLNIKGNGADTDSGALRGILGYDLMPNLAIEGMVAGGTSSDSNQGVTMKLHDSYGLFLKPKVDVGSNVELFGRLGWARSNVDVSCASGCANTSGNDFAYGLGVNYKINQQLRVGLDYTHLMDRGGVKVDGVTLGVGYHF
ncbi:MAG: porin family protein [Burkholderiales bacterium]|nr:porin family protein [Burkholderiales bacterium]